MHMLAIIAAVLAAPSWLALVCWLDRKHPADAEHADHAADELRLAA